MKLQKKTLSPYKDKGKIGLFGPLALSFVMLTSLNASAQTGKVNVNVTNVPLKEFFSNIEKQTPYRFSYRDLEIDGKGTVSVNVKNEELKTLLVRELAAKGLTYKMAGNKIVVLPAGNGKQGKVTVEGVVKDANGEPLIGVTVMRASDKTAGTITDFNGAFSMANVPEGDRLIVSYVGYKDHVVIAQGGRTLQITLKEDTQTLDEVVVVGYGTQKKANLTGAVASVKMDEVLGNRPLTSAAAALQGTVPGLLVSSGGNAPGQGKSFQIRGAYSVGIKNSDGSYGSTISPLVLIDNVEGSLDLVNPEDIETVTVLKDAASAAIYGARAAGGVILVTTKRPKGETTFKLNYNNNFAFANAVNLPKQAALTDYLKAYSDAAGDQFWTMGSPSVSKWLDYLEQYRQNPSSIPVVGDGLYKDEEGGVYYLHEKDLVDNMLETSFQQTHNLSVSGGTKKLRFRLSGAYTNNDGVLITDKDNYRRMNVSGFLSADITDWFTQEATFNYASSKRQLPSSSLGAIYSTRLASFYPEGTMPEGITEAGTGLPFFTPSNQIRWSNPATTKIDNPRIFLKSILKPLKGLEIAFEYTFDKNINDYHYYTGSNSYTTVQGGKDTTPTEDYLQKTKQYTNYNSINLYGTYSFSWGNHQLKAMAGFNQESSYLESMQALSYGQAVVEVPALGSGTSTLKATDSYNEYSVRGGFFRLSYNYKERYLFEANGRYDGSSKFPKDSRYGFFPSVSAGWNLAQERFMEQTKNWLGSLKLRASYGMIGNQNVAAYSFIPTMSVNNKYNGWLQEGTYVTAVTSLPSLVSSSFTWEKVSTINAGLDFSMFANRFTGTFDWYQRNTNGMLAPGMQLPAVVGASAPYQNTADMRTRGWELTLNWRDYIGKVGYRIGLNLSDSKSTIVKYDSNESKLLSNYYEGMELGEIWGYVYDGFYSVDDFEDTSSWKLKEGVTTINGYNPRPGDVKFKNLRDDDKGTNVIYAGNNTLENPGDRKIIGNNQPRYLYGITLGGNYAGFDLNVFLQGTGKRDVWLANTLIFPLYSDFKFVPLYEGLTDYWKPVDAANGDYTCANPSAAFPRIYGNYGNQGSNYRVSDRYLSDASYLRIKNVTLSYSFPKTWIQRFTLTQLKAFVSVENLATFTSLTKGIDPETLSWSYPAFRTVSFGINVTL